MSQNSIGLKPTPKREGPLTVGGRGATLKLYCRSLEFHGLLSIHIGAEQMEKIGLFLKDPTQGLKETKADQSIL